MRVPRVLLLLVLLALASSGRCQDSQLEPDLDREPETEPGPDSMPSKSMLQNIIENSIGVATGVVSGTLNRVENVARTSVDVAKEATYATSNLITTAGKSTLNLPRNVAVGVKNTIQDYVIPDDACYDGLDCFSMSSPWHSVFRPLPPPQSPESIGTRFYLYTRSSPKRRFKITWRFEDGNGTDGGMTLAGSDFDGSRKTFFITHGFASNGKSSWLQEMKDALLDRFDANVFLVDWGKGASKHNYFQVASNTRVVGAILIKLGHLLVKQHNCDPSRMHAIGHSLGAQISSYFAKNMTTLARLTALDPAQPAFEHYDRRVRLDATDAALVDVVHTSARPFVPFVGLGMVGAHGHIDFYMNGGWNQPGCYWPDLTIKSFFNLAIETVEAINNLMSCPHGRSYEFFTASLVTNTTVWAHRFQRWEKLFSAITGGYGAQLVIPDGNACDWYSCSPFGYDAFDFPARGIFGVATTSRFPFFFAEPNVDFIMRNYRLDPREEEWLHRPRYRR